MAHTIQSAIWYMKGPWPRKYAKVSGLTGASNPGLHLGPSESRLTSAGLIWTQMCTLVSWWEHFASDIPLFIPQENCAQWAMCVMCFRLCLSDIFLQSKTDKFRWSIPYFYIFRNRWLIDWVFSFSQKYLMLGRLGLQSSPREKKIYLKVSFSINILGFTKWLWEETTWLMRQSPFPHTPTKGLLSSHGHPLPLWQSAPKPSSELSCYQTLLSYLKIGLLLP